jgi:hypothetical protein
MRELVFEVDGQRLKKQADCDFSGLVAGSEGYLKAKFVFSSEWAGCKKAASFWVGEKEHPALLDETDSCIIRPEALTGASFKVSVVGVKTNYKIVSNRTKVRQEVY